MSAGNAICRLPPMLQRLPQLTPRAARRFQILLLMVVGNATCRSQTAAAAVVGSVGELAVCISIALASHPAWQFALSPA